MFRDQSVVWCGWQVHKMLIDVVDSLVAGGETGIFTPMHMLVFRKPLATAE